MSREAFTQVLASLAAAISLLERGGKKAAASDRMFEQMLNDYRAALEAGRAALFQQAEPECDWCAGAGHDFYGDKCIYCKSEPAPAQDEREAFREFHLKEFGCEPQIDDSSAEFRLTHANRWKVWLARAARPARTAPQSEEVNAAIRNLRCIAKTVLSGESKASMRADLESTTQLLIRLSTRPEQTAQGADHD